MKGDLGEYGIRKFSPDLPEDSESVNLTSSSFASKEMTGVFSIVNLKLHGSLNDAVLV